MVIVPDITVPDGVSGAWRVETFTVSDYGSAFSSVRSAVTGDSGCTVPAGSYKRLMCDDTVVMSNTPMEIRSHRVLVVRAKGRVLLNGLGLGLALGAILAKDVVTEVIVVEKSMDVISLVAPSYTVDSRVTIVHADAFTYKPTGKFDAVWHDIWNFVCAENLPEMTKLHRKYSRRAAWQASWRYRDCLSMSRRFGVLS